MTTEDDEDEIVARSELEAADLLDPNPDILGLFCYYDDIYFDNKLHSCTVEWSTSRMTLCAGICKYGIGSCAIRLSEPLLKFRSSVEVKETLLHEMIHAYLWLTNNNQNHDDHGPSFLKIMDAINGSTVLDHQRPVAGYHISVYHDYFDEVNSYRKHHWKCVKCGHLIKRATNRAPSHSDCYQKTGWRDKSCSNESCKWHRHQQLCGGEYEKIAEPAGYKKRKQKGGNFAVHSKEKEVPSEAPVIKEASIRQEPEIDSSRSRSKKLNVESSGSQKKTSLENYFPPKSVDIGREEAVGAMASNDHFQSQEQCSSEEEEPKNISTKKAKWKDCNSDDNKKTFMGCDSVRDDFYSTSDGKPAVTMTKVQEVQNTFEPISEQENKCTVIIGWRSWHGFEDEEDDSDVMVLENKRSKRRMVERALSQVTNTRGTGISDSPERYQELLSLDTQVPGVGKEKSSGRKVQNSVTLHVFDSSATNVAEVSNIMPVAPHIKSIHKPTIVVNEFSNLIPLCGVSDAQCFDSEMLKPDEVAVQESKIWPVRYMVKGPNDSGCLFPVCHGVQVQNSLEQPNVPGTLASATVSRFKQEGGSQTILSSMDHEIMVEKQRQKSSEMKDMDVLDVSGEIQSIRTDRFKRQREEPRRLNAALPQGEPSATCPICDMVLLGNIEDASFNMKFNEHIDACMGGASH